MVEKISGSLAYILISKLYNVKQACITWNRNEFGNIHHKLSKIKELTFIYRTIVTFQKLPNKNNKNRKNSNNF